MIRFIILSLILLIHYESMGQGHIPVFPEMEGRSLLFAVQDEYTPFVVLTYREARELMYRDLFNRNDSVYCVYTGHTQYLDPKTTDPISYIYRNGEANGINCEHTFPQSLGAKDGNARSDMHHLFPTRVAVNEARSNLPYGEIEDRDTERWYMADRLETKIPSRGIDQYSEYIKGLFEPREDHKGNVARAMFYFATIYRDQADTSWFENQLKDLCKWHSLDPVDDAEWDRNQRIADHQSGKANPFILDCTLAYRCFCPDEPPCIPQTSIKDVTPRSCNILPTDGSGRNWELDCREHLEISVDVYNVHGAPVKRILFEEKNMDSVRFSLDGDIVPGWYVIRISESKSGQFIHARPFVIVP